MDSCLNPAIEQQAQDRAHRIGQHKPVRCVLHFLYFLPLNVSYFCLLITRIVRFVIEDTIDERILQSQEKKKHFQRQVPFSYSRLDCCICFLTIKMVMS